jgi:nodulation protein E
MRRVGISGMGAVSAAGIGVSPLWTAARDGVSHVKSIDLPRGENLRVRIAASVTDFEPTDYLSDSEIRWCDRYTQFAHVAVNEALAQAQLSDEELEGPRTAVIIGTGIGGMSTLDEGCYNFYTGDARISPLSIPRLMPSSASAHVSIAHKITGPSFSITSACSSASQSIGVGLQMIRAGIVDRAIVGGSEACITPATVKAWELLRVLSPTACRPFSKDRSGLILGEGAGVVVLEAEELLQARDRTPIAWLAGYGTSSDARDFIQPDVEGATSAISAAIADANMRPEDIDYVNAHGTGTVLNDINEAAALQSAFGARLQQLPVSSTKSIIGHALGAAGGLELIVAVMALADGIVPPQANFSAADERCPIPNLPTAAVEAPLRAALSNTFAFGGINASLIVSKAAA